MLKVMSDRLLWLCRGCKDPEPSHEPAAAPINSDEGSSVSESSSSIEVPQIITSFRYNRDLKIYDVDLNDESFKISAFKETTV